MMHALFTSPLLILPTAAVFGFCFGLFYFGAVRQTAAQIARREHWSRPTALTVARLAGAVLLFLFLAKLGPWPLLAGFVGFLIARAVIRRGGGSGDDNDPPETP